MVFATPALVRYFEAAAIEAVRSGLAPGEGTIGKHMAVRHIAATTVGMRITFRGTLTEVDGPRLTFRIEAADEREPIGEVTHDRFRVNMDRFLTRAMAKSRA